MRKQKSTGKSQTQLAQKQTDDDESGKMYLAEAMIQPSANAAAVIESFQGNLGGTSVVLERVLPALRADIKKLESGDASRLEAMLYSQAVALQTIFSSLARRASNQEYLKQYDTYLSFALRAQAQSRATIQAIVELKYPRQVAFVKQANIAHGHQQVNNGQSTEPEPHAKSEKQVVQTKLLETDNGKRGKGLDTRTPKTTKRGHKAMATVGQGDRPKER